VALGTAASGTGLAPLCPLSRRHAGARFGRAYLEPPDERYRLLFDRLSRLLVRPSRFNLGMPPAFRRTAHGYLDGDRATRAHMRSAEMRHFMLSDLYDYCYLSSRLGQGPW
jgi:hypothetical protein